MVLCSCFTKVRFVEIVFYYSYSGKIVYFLSTYSKILYLFLDNDSNLDFRLAFASQCFGLNLICLPFVFVKCPKTYWIATKISF